MPELQGVIEAARGLVERAEATAEPIAANTNLSVEGRIAAIGEADQATRTDFAQLEERVRTAREAAAEAARGATIDVDAGLVATASQRLERLRGDGASGEQILARAVEAGDSAMLVALRRDLVYHAAHLDEHDRATVDQWGGTAGFVAKLDAAELPFLPAEAREARETLAEADRVAGTLLAERRLLDAILDRQVVSRPGPHQDGGVSEQHLVSDPTKVNLARLSAAYAEV